MARGQKVSSKPKVVVSNPDKVLYPAAHFTKAQVIEVAVLLRGLLQLLNELLSCPQS